jgi:hypothetical protein
VNDEEDEVVAAKLVSPQLCEERTICTWFHVLEAIDLSLGHVYLSAALF